MSRFAPKNFAEALRNTQSRPARARKAISKGKGFQPKPSSLGPKAPRLRCARKPLRTKLDPELLQWGKDVKKRDGNICQWPNCEFCHNDSKALLDPHHKALRSARHDLRLALDNGVTVCRSRHDFIHSPQGRNEAVRLGFLNPRTRELAAKEGTLGIY